MAPHSSVLAWRIPWTEGPGGLPSMGSHRVRHDWSDLAAAAAAAWALWQYILIPVYACCIIIHTVNTHQHLLNWITHIRNTQIISSLNIINGNKKEKLHLSYLHLCILYMEKAMAPHSSTLAWKIPWMEEPGRLRSMGSLRVRQDWATSLSLFSFMHWRRKWQPPPVFLPGESQGWGRLVGCHLWDRTESDTTEAT